MSNNKDPQDPVSLPEQPIDPASPTPEELEEAEWAADERKRWEALSNALETLGILGDYLEKGQHPKEGLDVQTRVEQRISWKVLLKRLKMAIIAEMSMTITDLLDAGHELPEAAQTDPSGAGNPG